MISRQGTAEDVLPASTSLHVVADAPAHEARASALASQLGVTMVAATSAVPGALTLRVGTSLRLRTDSGIRDLVVDANADAIRRRAAAGRSLELLRALPAGRGLRIVDATAGLGRDAFTLVHAGHDVTLIERHPLLAVLLEDALQRLMAPGRAVLLNGDAVGLLAQLWPAPDVVYLDPMFATVTQSLPKAAAQWLRRLANEPSDLVALLRAALSSGARRVIVKRPRHGELAPAAGFSPHHSIAGRSVRFDVYQT